MNQAVGPVTPTGPTLIPAHGGEAPLPGTVPGSGGPALDSHPCNDIGVIHPQVWTTLWIVDDVIFRRGQDAPENTKCRNLVGCGISSVRLPGLEPGTSVLSGLRSNRLSYRRMV